MTLQDTEAAERFYTRISRVYDAVAEADEHVARELGLRWLDARPDEHILEVGFGTGTAIVRVAQAVGEHGRVLGIDISEGMRQVAGQRVAAAQVAGTVELRVAAIPPIPAADRSFDAAFMAFTLELFPDGSIPLVLQEIRRVLRRAGRLVVVAMNAGDGSHRASLAERTYRWLHHHFPHIIDCRPIDVVGVLGEVGFAVTRTTPVDIWGLPVTVCRAFSNPAGRTRRAHDDVRAPTARAGRGQPGPARGRGSR
jgi:demethylmenaquinone methyltransferase/2-methoxy-6-polyprenyl-1,4-benzoquinol methylase